MAGIFNRLFFNTKVLTFWYFHPISYLNMPSRTSIVKFSDSYLIFERALTGEKSFWRKSVLLNEYKLELSGTMRAVFKAIIDKIINKKPSSDEQILSSTLLL